MSVSSRTPLSSPQSNSYEIVLTPSATVDAAVLSGATYKLASLVIDNSGNSSAVTLKIIDAATATVGTTSADHEFTVKAGKVMRMNFSDDKPTFATGLTMWCVTSTAVTGATSPTSTVTVTLVAHQ